MQEQPWLARRYSIQECIKKAKGITNMYELHQFLDLHRADIDPEEFAAALAVQYISRLISYGGANKRYGLEDVPSPSELETFLARAVETAAKTRRFVHQWRMLQQQFPRKKVAWEKGQALFQEDLAHALERQEEMEYLTMIDFAADCFAYATTKKTYPEDPACQAWAINGYMAAWRRHFLSDEDLSQNNSSHEQE